MFMRAINVFMFDGSCFLPLSVLCSHSLFTCLVKLPKPVYLLLGNLFLLKKEEFFRLYFPDFGLCMEACIGFISFIA